MEILCFEIEGQGTASHRAYIVQDGGPAIPHGIVPVIQPAKNLYALTVPTITSDSSCAPSRRCTKGIMPKSDCIPFASKVGQGAEGQRRWFKANVRLPHLDLSEDG